MKHAVLLFVFVIANTSFLFSAASFNSNASELQLAKQIEGKGITITNAVVTRGQRGGPRSQVATFSNGISGANLLIDEGVLLTASTAREAFSTNDSGRKSLDPSNRVNAERTVNNVPSLPAYDSDLMTTITQNRILNQVVFEFDVTLDANTRLLLVDYQFASDEYPEWVGSQFNDAFGFFISGGDLTQTYNIARVVDDSIIVSTSTINTYPPVNINNVNNGSVGNQADGATTDLTNSRFFIDNGGTDVGSGGLNSSRALIISEFDGFTTKLHATLDNLTPGQTYHFKMALADTFDANWDAGVFVNKIIGVKEPSVCYSYDVRVGSGVNVPSINNDINTTAFPGEKLTLGIVIQSMEGEIQLEDSNLSVILNPNDSLQFLSAEISPDSINAYDPIPDAFVNKVPFAQVPIGENITAVGGTIGQNQVIFTNLLYDFNGSSNQINTHFELAMDLKLTLNGISAPRHITTAGANPTLVRCPTQTGYFPEWARFNVERTNSTDPLLYTQISGRPFNVDIVSYDPNATSALKKIKDVVLELELIDASKYTDSNQSLFTCREPDSVTQGQAIAFKTLTNRVPAPTAITTNNAIRSAAFRLWYLADRNHSVVKHECDDFSDNSCFNALYDDEFKDTIDTAPYRCASACNGSGNCYQCLKTYFARPICSRDNFSVRPVSYRIAIHDNNESNITNAPQVNIGQNNIATLPLTLAAEYNYKLDVNATLFGSDNAVSRYFARFPNTGQDLISSFMFQRGTTGNNCANTANARQDIVFRDGVVKFTSNNLISNTIFYSHNNVGVYNYHIEDNNWTIVDQRRYPNKTFPNSEECISSGNNRYSISVDGNTRSGCGISSNQANAISGFSYTDLPLQFEPFSFGLNQVRLNRRPNKNVLFMNDFNTSYYGTVLGANISMATSFEGNLTALGKNGTVLSNFTTGCSSSAVRLDLNRTMNPIESSLTNAPLQQYLEVGLAVVSQQSGIGTGLILPRTAFTNAGQGQAAMSLHTTLSKPYGLGNRINPVQINYSDLNATAVNAQSNAQMMPGNYIPKGGNNYDNNVTYVYGKVTPRKRLYNDVEEKSKKTELYADIYCTLPSTQCSDLNLTTVSLGEQESESGWWLATIFSNTELGRTTLNISHDSEQSANPSIAFNGGPSSNSIPNMPFDDNRATQQDINVSVSGLARPSTQRVDYIPPPWLIYESKNPKPNPKPKNDTDFYRVRFIGPSAWSGVGKTGLVTDTESYDEDRRKMSW
jgi:hypothetical protein